jgi:hypothetical protein
MKFLKNTSLVLGFEGIAYLVELFPLVNHRLESVSEN